MADGTIETGTILDRIVADKRGELERSRSRVSLLDLQNRVVSEKRTSTLGEQWRLGRAIAHGSRMLNATDQKVKLIAEIKVKSPSKGQLVWSTKGKWLERFADLYTVGGACGISVVTERKHFDGRSEYLRTVWLYLKRRYPAFRPSILRKDFLFDEYHILEAFLNGADGVLLIVAILEEELLKELITLAEINAMDALVEVHDEAEVEKALRAGAQIIGINNRDLRTFDVDLATTERLRPLIPDGKLIVAESGTHNRADVERLAACGVHAILVGEALVTARSIHEKMKELII